MTRFYENPIFYLAKYIYSFLKKKKKKKKAQFCAPWKPESFKIICVFGHGLKENTLFSQPQEAVRKGCSVTYNKVTNSKK